jgi:hypothetical protein
VINNESKIKVEGFTEFVDSFTCTLASFANYALVTKEKRHIFNTLFLGRSNSHASRLEEVLDHYNAKNNREWAPFRENIAAIKSFTSMFYITLHLKSTSPQYNLRYGIETFLKDTDDTLEIFYDVLICSFRELVKISKKKGLKICTDIDKKDPFTVTFPEGRLESDVKKKKITSPEKVIVNLATSYLNLASESVLLDDDELFHKKNHSELVPDILDENKLRDMENRFHNLQSLYDTYISNTDIEDHDEDLKLIRGHASIVYHLLEAATCLIHYYERHMMIFSESTSKTFKPPISQKKILGLLINYFLNYAGQFLNGGVKLCKAVIKKYAEEGSVVVGVPGYRGFHVRPSTLVSKIVQHYGSDVYLVMGDEKYNASHPMDLFRVNEKINAEKRRNLAKNIYSLKAINDPECNNNFNRGLKEVFHELLEENKIVNYSTEFSLPDIQSISEETLGEFANRAIAFLLAQGKIDLRTDLKVSFEGDKRVLADLELLARSGYGEDSYGNNTVLPKELSYIRR